MTTSRETLRVRLRGTAPLLMRSSRLADPLDDFTVALERLTRKRVKLRSDHVAIARTEWAGGMWTCDGAPCVPGSAIESCLLQAAKARKAGAAVKAGVSVPGLPMLSYEGPKDLDALWADERYRLRVPVRIRGVRTMRTRARFPAWGLVAEIRYLPSLIARRDLLDDLVVGGDTIGLGDWRPRFGSFAVEIAE